MGHDPVISTGDKLGLFDVIELMLAGFEVKFERQLQVLTRLLSIIIHIVFTEVVCINKYLVLLIMNHISVVSGKEFTPVDLTMNDVMLQARDSLALRMSTGESLSEISIHVDIIIQCSSKVILI